MRGILKLITVLTVIIAFAFSAKADDCIPRPNITTSASTTFCQGNSVTLFSSHGPGYNYQWQRDSVDIPSANDSFYVATQTGFYTVKVTAAGCTKTSVPTEVTVHPNPTIAVSNDTTVCEASTVTLWASGGTAYQWSGGGPAAPNFVLQASFSRTYTVTVTNDFNCSQSANVNVDVIQLPQTWTTTPSSTTFCQGESVTISASNQAGYTYQWKRNNSSIPGANNHSYQATTQGNYTVDVTANGCTGTSDPVPVTVHPLPTLNVSNDVTICEGDSATLYASSNGDYLWDQGSTTPSITVAPTTTKTYSVTATNQYNCTRTKSVTVNVIPLASGSVSTSGSTTLCDGQSVTLYATAGADNYQWYKDDNPINGAINNAFTANTSGDYKVFLSANGCLNTSQPVTVTINPVPDVTVSNDTTICAGDEVTLWASGGTSYQWSNGGPADPVFEVTTSFPRTYTVTVSNNYGCSVSASVSVNTISLPQAWTSTSSSTTLCQGQSVTITTSNQPTYSYKWTRNDVEITGANNHNYAADQQGTYKVIVTENGCSKTSAGVPVTVNPIPTLSVSADTTICQGDTVTIWASSNGNYLWNTGSTNASLTVFPNSTKTYSVTASNQYSCTVSEDITVNVIPLTSGSVSTSGPTTFCNGQSVTLYATNGADIYQWYLDDNPIPGAESSSYTVDATGTYKVVVTGSGCVNTSLPVDITVNSNPEATIIDDTTTCSGDTLTLWASGGTSYQWSNGGPADSAFTIYPTYSRSYNVTVTNDFNCSAQENVTVNVKQRPQAWTSTSSSTTICEGQSVTISTSNQATYVYQWMRDNTPIAGANNYNYSANEQGVYRVIVMEDGCSKTSDPVPVTVNPIPEIITCSDTTICAGEDVKLWASAEGSFLWNLGSTDTAITVNPVTSRSYSVTVTNAYTCSQSATINVSTAPLPNAYISTSGVTTFCEGNSVNLNAPANAGYTYQWLKDGSPMVGETSQTYNCSETGVYNVVVTENNNCHNTSSPANVTVHPLPEVSLNEDTVICSGVPVQLTAGGGSNYLWNTGYADADYLVSPQDTTTYTVTVTDQNNCTSSDQVTVSTVPLPDASISLQGDATLCTGETVTINAIQDSTYSYQWRNGSGILNGEDGPSYTASLAGKYVVVVAADGCSNISDTTTVIVHPRPEATASNDTTVCSGEPVLLSAFGGTSYEWSNGSLDSATTVYPNATRFYTVTVTNQYNCSDIENVLVSTIPAPNASVTTNTPTNICQGQSVTLNASTAGSYDYQWQRYGINLTGETGPSYTASITGIYTVVVEAFGCVKTSMPIDVAVNPIPAVTISNDTTICQGSVVTISATGGTTYHWSNGANGPDNTVSPATSDSYTVTVTDANGCTNANHATVTVLPVPLAYVTTNRSTNLCQGESVQLTASNNTLYTYQWYRDTAAIAGATDSMYEASQQGAYTVIVSRNGCSKTSSPVNITVNPIPHATISNDTAICSGASVVLSASGGSSYSWSNGSSNSSITVSPFSTKTYTVSVTAGSYCADVKSTTITVHQTPNAYLLVSGSPSICDGESVTINANRGQGFTYEWFRDNVLIPGADSSQIITDQPGSYSVIVNSNGCQTQSTPKVVEVNPVPVVSLSEDTLVCAQSTVNLIVSGGISYQWNTWSTDSVYQINPTSSKTYTVTVTNIHGCEASDSVRVDVIPLPNISISTNTTTTICEGDSVTLTANSDPGVSFQWQIDASSIPGAIGPKISAGKEGDYSVIVTSNSCSKISAPTSITVKPKPPTPQVILMGEDTLFSSLQGGNYRWFRDGTIHNVGDRAIKITKSGIYSVIVFENNCPSDTSDAFPFYFDGIAMSNNLKMIVYPNPSAGIFNISLEKATTKVQIKVLNSIGKQVYSQQPCANSPCQSFSLDLRHLAKGLYFLEITSQKKRAFRKVVIE